MGAVVHDSVKVPATATDKDNGFVSTSPDPLKLDAGALFVLKSKGLFVIFT